jgi:hypothetical protein
VPDADWIGSGDLVEGQRGVVPDLPAVVLRGLPGSVLLDAMLEFKGAEFKVPEIP